MERFSSSLLPLSIKFVVKNRNEENAHKCSEYHSADKRDRERILQVRAHISPYKERGNRQYCGKTCHENRFQPPCSGHNDRSQQAVPFRPQFVYGIYLENRVVDDYTAHDNYTYEGHDIYAGAEYPQEKETRIRALMSRGMDRKEADEFLEQDERLARFFEENRDTVSFTRLQGALITFGRQEK